MTPQEKFVRLAVLLSNRTMDKKIAWTSSGEQAVQAEISGRYVELSSGRSFNDEPLEYVTIRDAFGSLVDQFDDETLSGQPIPFGSRHTGFFNLMGATRQAALRQALGADEAIDSIINELDADDDDIPF